MKELCVQASGASDVKLRNGNSEEVKTAGRGVSWLGTDIAGWEAGCRRQVAGAGGRSRNQLKLLVRIQNDKEPESRQEKFTSGFDYQTSF
jgi:hypothetical protein